MASNYVVPYVRVLARHIHDIARTGSVLTYTSVYFDHSIFCPHEVSKLFYLSHVCARKLQTFAVACSGQDLGFVEKHCARMNDVKDRKNTVRARAPPGRLAGTLIFRPLVYSALVHGLVTCLD